MTGRAVRHGLRNMPSPRCALQERSLFEGELDCLLREKCICENECPLSCHANVQLNRGLVTHVVLGCRRRWRHIPNRDADQEVPTVTKWLRTALSRIFPDLPSPSDVDLELMVKHALEYNQIIGRASKPVRRALLAVPYIVGGDDKTNFDTTPGKTAFVHCGRLVEPSVQSSMQPWLCSASAGSTFGMTHWTMRRCAKSDQSQRTNKRSGVR